MSYDDLKSCLQIGTNDLRAVADGAGGFGHVVLRDADDGDTIVVNENDVSSLRDYLNIVIEKFNLT